MNLLTDAENYLDNAGGFTLDKEGTIVCLIVWFDDQKFAPFSDEEGYLSLVEFFKERNITMVIKGKVNAANEEEYFYRSSLVDMDTADVVNLNSTLWGPETLQELRDTVRVDSSMEFVVVIVDKVRRQFNLHSLYKTHSPMMLHGYSFEEDPCKEGIDQ